MAKPNGAYISKPEVEIKKYFSARKIKCVAQYQIPGLKYYYDLYLPEYNLLIEYNGSFFHCNPKTYKSGQLVGKRKQLSVDKVWHKDEVKIESAKVYGYNIEVIWDVDYLKNKTKAIKKLVGKYEKQV